MASLRKKVVVSMEEKLKALKRLRDLAARKRQEEGKQKTITNFFSQA
jgi:hypothetical protein